MMITRSHDLPVDFVIVTLTLYTQLKHNFANYYIPTILSQPLILCFFYLTKNGFAKIFIFSYDQQTKITIILFCQATLIFSNTNQIIFKTIKLDFINKFQQQIMEQNIDYRNAKYQGCLNSHNLRHGIGILIDDDLSFYISDWNKGELSGQTMIYLNHGKYIYGQWANNQPHGLNVFRIGDTVLVAFLQNGQIKGRMIVIFQRFNFIAVMQNKLNNQFQVIERGQLRDHEDLLKYIGIMQHKVPQNYFSLIKFICSFVNESIKAVPSKDGNCYFGFDMGLAIVFNSHNGVVSIGYHKQGKLAQFGGKFESNGKGEQGNFQTKQIISYRGHRPRNEIYSVFQKTHKRALSFQNSYFHSKFITLAKVQNLLRGKIGEIADNSRQNKVTLADLNDSLDYQSYLPNQADQINEKRMNLYEKQMPPMKKTTSKFYDESTPKTPKKQKTPRVTKRIIEGTPKKSQKEEVINVEKFEYKKGQKTPQSKINNKSQIKNCNGVNVGLEYYHQLKQTPASKSNEPFFKTQNKNVVGQKKHFDQDQDQGFISFFPNEQKNTYTDVHQKANNNNNEPNSNHKEIFKNNAVYKSPIRAGKIKENKIIANQQALPQNQSPYRLSTKYQDLNERRKRLLTEFRNLNNLQQENNEENDQQSPYLREKLNSYSSKRLQENINTSEYLPLTLTKMPKNSCNSFESVQFNPNTTAKFLKENIAEPKPVIEQTQELMKSYSRNQIYLSPLKRKNLNYTADYNNMVEQKPNYDRNPTVQLSRDKSYSKLSTQMNQSMTPSKKKYQYYFND